MTNTVNPTVHPSAVPCTDLLRTHCPKRHSIMSLGVAMKVVRFWVRYWSVFCWSQSVGSGISVGALGSPAPLPIKGSGDVVLYRRKSRQGYPLTEQMHLAPHLATFPFPRSGVMLHPGIKTDRRGI